MTLHDARQQPLDGSRTPLPESWSDAPSRDALQLIAEGVTQVAGFGVAAISVVRDDGLLEVMAVAGSEAARAQLTGVRTPVAELMAEIEKADRWGLLRFLPHERLDLRGGNWGWVPDLEPLDGEDAWHPMDLLIAPLEDREGHLRGTLSIDMPADGRRPGDAQRAVLQTYAEQAGRAVVIALEREALAIQVRLAEAARIIVRNASAQRNLDRILVDSNEAIVDGFRASGMWIQTFDEVGLGTGSVHAAVGVEVTLSDEMVVVAETAARRAWSDQRVEIIGPGRTTGPAVSATEAARIRTFLGQNAIGSILFTPLGAGDECLGNLVLTRAEGSPDWTDVEGAAALDIGHDLGRAILNARTFEREQRLIDELRALDAYKSQLIATLAHELKNPLVVIQGHLELLESSPHLTQGDQSSLTVLDRAAGRMTSIVDDLLFLARVGDPGHRMKVDTVDLQGIVSDAVELASLEAKRRDLTLAMDVPTGAVLALGDADRLDRVCTNLVSNALKYTPAGRVVTIGLGRSGDTVVLWCTDEGIGISVEDQAQLFTEFFRSSNRAALEQPGTGLGLTIVRRIVERHGGRVEVESELGVGSTFRVHLPAASA